MSTSRFDVGFRLGLVSGALVLCLGSGCVEQSSDAPTEEDVKAARDNILQTAPTPRYPVTAVLEAPSGQGHGKLTYLGMDVDEVPIQPGKAFTLTHYFRVEEPTGEGWRLFVHLEAPGDKKSHLNADHVPIGGKYPVPLWKKGEIIRDIHKVSLPPAWPAGQVEIYTGIWKGQARFKVSSGPNDGDNRVLVARIPVAGAAPAAPPPQKRLIARKLPPGTALNIDGKLDDPAWKDAASTGLFVNTLTGGPAEQRAEAKVLWDDQNLYVAFDFADTDVWGTMTKHDDKLWTQEAAEMFLDADGDGKTYVEIQINPRNVTFDSWLPAYRQNDNSFDIPMKTAVQVRGTLDNRNDVDQGWTAEMQIPLSAAKGKLPEMRNVPPKPGNEWRVNFFRMDQPAGKPQVASGWSPPMVPDFHALNKFGTLVFADDKGIVPAADNTMAAPPGEGGPHQASAMTRRMMVAHPLATQTKAPEAGKAEKQEKAPAKKAKEK